jgi:hypothetical protein
VLLTRPPLELKTPVRLACIRHTASVHPEPGSNSLKISLSLFFIKNFVVILSTKLLQSIPTYIHLISITLNEYKNLKK